MSQPTVTLDNSVQEIEYEGARLVFDVEMSQASPRSLLVLVNGFQRPRGDFRAFRKRLHASMPDVVTLALDNRGTGESELLGDTVTVPQMARDVRYLVDLFLPKLGLSSYNVLGISMGGLISLCLVHGDERVEKLILVSTSSGGAGRHVPAWLKDKERGFQPWPTDEEGMRARLRPYFGEKFLKKAPLLVNAMVKGMLNKAKEPGTQKGSQLQFQASRAFDGTLFLSNIRAQTLVVTGLEDGIMPHENAHYLHENIEGSKLIEYPEVGHLILIEEPEKFVADVANFLQT